MMIITDVSTMLHGDGYDVITGTTSFEGLILTIEGEAV